MARDDSELDFGAATGRPQGGDVKGTTLMDGFGAQGRMIEVARASYDPGYPLRSTLNDAGTQFSEADLRQGFCSYGKAVGEAK